MTASEPPEIEYRRPAWVEPPADVVPGIGDVLMCADCQAARGHGSGPYPVMTRAELRAGLELLPTPRPEDAATHTTHQTQT